MAFCGLFQNKSCSTSFFTPWAHTFNNDGIKRVDKLSYFAGTMRIYVSKYEWMSNLVKFANSNLPNNLYTVSATSQKVQFLVHGLQPDICKEDRDLFESSFGCTIKYFIKSRKSGLPISIAAVEGMRHLRDDLCTSRPRAFNCFSIHFTLKSFSEQDDYVFPRCNICQQWGHWCQNCKNLKDAKCCHCSCADHTSDRCPTHLRGIAQIVRDLMLLSSKAAQSLSDTGRGSKIGGIFPLFRRPEAPQARLQLRLLRSLLQSITQPSRMRTRLLSLLTINWSPWSCWSVASKRPISTQNDEYNPVDDCVDRDSEFVNQIIKEPSELINNGVADLIPVAGPIRRKSKKPR
ncbi:hypothetical protein ACOME3_010808 [Neoechinorhynchus agilis]